MRTKTPGRLHDCLSGYFLLPPNAGDDLFLPVGFNPSIVLFVGGGLHCIIEDKHIFARILHEVVA